MRSVGLLSLLLLFWIACTTQVEEQKPKLETPIEEIHHVPICEMELRLEQMGLVKVQDINPRIEANLRYNSTNNFMKIKLYECLDEAYVQKEVAYMLDSAQKILEQKKPGYRLFIWDAVRPISVQQMMWDSLKMPFEEKTKYVSNPKNRSVHNFGCAVDLTIADSSGSLLDMGTDFDYFGLAAHTNKDSLNLALGNLTKQQTRNRNLLRRCMFKAGFRGLQSEWWHFNAFSRAEVKKRYKAVE